ADQHTLGFSVQTALIGIGAVVGSWLPYVLNEWFGVSNLPTISSAIPDNLIYSFVIGAAILVASILVTIFTTKEYSPEELLKFRDEKEHQEAIGNEKEARLTDIFRDFTQMPETMRQLSWVQFFSWFGLFGMWVFTTPAIAQHIYGLSVNDTKSPEFQSAGDWVGIIFGVYNFVSAIFAFVLPYIAKKIGRRKTHALSLILGGIGLVSMYFMPTKEALIFSMVLVGFAWASILAMPYAILAGSIQPKKMGVYMGIFNFFIVIPQIINALIGGLLVKYLYNDHAIFAIVMSGLSFIVAAVLVLKVKDNKDV
ncbi:MAG TPA: MFS transporter, partial [Flavobacterium sp.]|nr:MFS transporter [Flavobacterium sp.]